MSIFPHKYQGRETGRLRVEVTVNGKKVVRYTDTRKEAVRVEKLLQAGIVVDGAGKEQRYSIEDLWQDSQTLWAGQKDETQSLVNLRSSLDALQKALGSTSLPEVRESHIEAAARLLGASRSRLGGVLSPASVNRRMAALSKALRQAARDGKITRKPEFDRAKRSEPAFSPFTLSEEQEDKLREAIAAHPKYGAVLECLMAAQIMTGCRISELLKLKPGDIERVNDGEEMWHEVVFRDTKSGKDRRAPIEDAGLAERLLGWVEAGLPSYDVIRDKLRGAREAAGLPTTQPTHAYRHTTATRLTRNGQSLAVVQDYLGHASPKTTLRYISLDTRSKREASRALYRGPRA
jgi:integrase